jgi:hypothetical protein
MTEKMIENKMSRYINPKVYDLYWDGEVPECFKRICKEHVVVSVSLFSQYTKYGHRGVNLGTFIEKCKSPLFTSPSIERKHGLFYLLDDN